MAAKIVVIEDERQIRQLIERELALEGYSTFTADRAGHGLELIRAEHPDLVLLDLNLPEMSGFELLERLERERLDVPVLVVSAREREADKVRALTLGADDYLTKPFGFSELIARVRAVLRRRAGHDRREILAVGRLVLDSRRREVYVGEHPIDLTLKEFEILRLLLERRGEVVSRDQFLDAIWPEVFVSKRTIDTHVALVRKKIGHPAPGVPVIVSIRGVGYKLMTEQL